MTNPDLLTDYRVLGILYGTNKCDVVPCGINNHYIVVKL